MALKEKQAAVFERRAGSLQLTSLSAFQEAPPHQIDFIASQRSCRYFTDVDSWRQAAGFVAMSPDVSSPAHDTSCIPGVQLRAIRLQLTTSRSWLRCLHGPDPGMAVFPSRGRSVGLPPVD